MRSLDTKVLVRYLANDDPAQSPRAEMLIEECLRKREPLFLTGIVLCELVWVLRQVYKLGRPAIAGSLEEILQKDLFRIEQDTLVRRSLEAYRRGRGDFADYLIAEVSRSAGCRDTVTFDQALRSDVGFTFLG